MTQCGDCKDHSGIEARMKNAEGKIEHLESRTEEIFERLNQILGTVLVAAVAGIISMLIPFMKGQAG